MAVDVSRIESLIGDRRFFITFVAIVTFLFLVETFLVKGSDDVVYYYNQAAQILSGHMPYSDFQFEYPPLAIIFFVIPGIVSWDVDSYRAAYAALAYVALFFLTYYSYKIADRYLMERWKVNLLIMLLVVVGAYFIFARFDIFPVVIAVIGLWLYMEKRYTLAFIVIALACMTKVYPGMFLIAMLIPFLMKKEWKSFFSGLLIFAAVCVIVELPFFLNDPSTAFSYLTYHSDRGLQIESVISSFIMFVAVFIPTDISIVYNYGSNNLTGVLPDAIAPYTNLMMAAFLVMFVLVILWRIHNSSRAKENSHAVVGLFCLAMLMIFILFSKVYSTQYVIWIIPMFIFALLPYIGPIHRKELTLILIPFFIFTVLSYMQYPALLEFNGVAVFFTVMKNVFHIILTMEIVHLCLYETRSDGCEEEHGMFERFIR